MAAYCAGMPLWLILVMRKGYPLSSSELKVLDE
jgi:hypothetical protein